jgi:signal transduction histidine kinase
MAAMAAHEIRNPIGIIRGAVELVQARNDGRLGPDDREALSDVLGEVERLRHLTQDFLDLARDPALVEAECDLSRLADEAAQGLARTHPEVEVVLRLSPTEVRCDEGRLRQILANLLQNAADAGARHVTITGEEQAGAVVLRVSDDGRGIAPDLQPRLFEPFATGRAAGTGLGLALSRRIAERHGGTLVLAATSPGGTSFELRLPRARG